MTAVKLARTVSEYCAACMLGMRALDCSRGAARELALDEKMVVATGWFIACTSLALRDTYWWLSWAAEIQGVDPQVFRDAAAITLVPDIFTIFGLSIATAPYATKVFNVDWPVLSVALFVGMLTIAALIVARLMA